MWPPHSRKRLFTKNDRKETALGQIRKSRQQQTMKQMIEEKKITANRNICCRNTIWFVVFVCECVYVCKMKVQTTVKTGQLLVNENFLTLSLDSPNSNKNMHRVAMSKCISSASCMWDLRAPILIVFIQIVPHGSSLTTFHPIST